MISPGELYKRVPKDFVANLKFRRFILNKAKASKAVQKALADVCRTDILFFVNTFVWQFNPRKKKGGVQVGPFITWDFQDEAIKTILWHIEEDRDLLIEKSREMGASWLCLIIMVWCCLFRPWQKFLCISHSEDAVDKPEDPDALLWKVNFIHEFLPDWLLGGGDDLRRKMKRKMAVTYPQTRSAITGAATSTRSGVGGRATAVFLDEFSKQQNDYEILGQTADTGCRIFNGTHYGVGTAFFDLTQRPDMHKLMMHWSQHPDKNQGMYRWDIEKNVAVVLDKNFHYAVDFDFVMDGRPMGGPYPGVRSPWYDKECVRRANARDVAMHLDIDPAGSVSQFFDALMIRQLRSLYAVNPYWEGELDYDTTTGKPIQLRKAQGGKIKLWYHLDHEGKPLPGIFAAGADCATGMGATPSCLSLANAQTGEKILEYADAWIKEEDFAAFCVAICRLFTAPDGAGTFLAWEMAGPGLKVGLRIVELGYRNIYYRNNVFEPFSWDPAEKPGWYPSPNAKRVILADYRADLNTRRFVNRSDRALEECLCFAYSSRGQVEHPNEIKAENPADARVNHADRVIADAICAMVTRMIAVPLRKKEAAEIRPGTLAYRRQRADNAKRQAGAWA